MLHSSPTTLLVVMLLPFAAAMPFAAANIVVVTSLLFVMMLMPLIPLLQRILQDFKYNQDTPEQFSTEAMEATARPVQQSLPS